jgi:hypothetical protein
MSCGKGCDAAKAMRGETATDHPKYTGWRQMVQRCHTPNAHNFQWYGGRGIEVCDRWRFGEDGRSGFECFLADMGPADDGMTVDRIDPNLGYEPTNCRWASWTEQNRNRRNNRRYEHGGKNLTAGEWQECTGIPASAITLRIRRGWTIAQALEIEPLPSGVGRRPNRARLLGQIAAAILFVVAALPLAAHNAPSGWEYSADCCSNMDCAPVPAEAVREVAGGYQVRLEPGQHPMLLDRSANAFIAHGDNRIRVSGDPDRHACVAASGHVYCIYVPPGGV